MEISTEWGKNKRGRETRRDSGLWETHQGSLEGWWVGGWGDGRQGGHVMC